jgi:peptidoglycan hydrolase CwlO-like protein
MKKLEEATTGMQTLTTKVEGHSDKVGALSNKVKGQGNKVSKIKQTMTTKIDNLNHTLTPRLTA